MIENQGKWFKDKTTLEKEVVAGVGFEPTTSGL